MASPISREGGLQRLSTLTAALALASVVGTGLVVHEAQTFTASAHSSATTSQATGGTATTSQTGLRAPSAPLTSQQAPPVTVSSGS